MAAFEKRMCWESSLAISVPSYEEVICPNCAFSYGAVLWVAVDLTERPDLRSELAAEAEWILSCPRCDEHMARRKPLFVCRLAHVAPLLLALPDDILNSTDGVPPDFVPIVRHVEESLGDEGRDVPGPIVRLPFDVLREVLARDLDDDAAIDPTPQSWVVELTTSERYGDFLARVQRSRPDREVLRALNHLFSVRGQDDLAAIRARFDDEVLTALRTHIAQDRKTANAQQTSFLSIQLKVTDRLLAADVSGAWTEYASDIGRHWTTFAEPLLDEILNRHEHAALAGDFETMVQTGKEVLDLVGTAEMDDLVADLSSSVAGALLSMRGRGRSARVDEAIGLLEQASGLIPRVPDEAGRLAQILVNLGAAYASRTTHDPEANRARAISLFEEALRLVSLKHEPDIWAMAQTNLALSLLEHRPLTDVDARRAIQHLRQALRWRTLERNALDWGFTQLTLGIAYSRSSKNRKTSAGAAMQHYANAARAFAASNDDPLQAQALHNLAADELVLAQLEGTATPRGKELLTSAKQHAEESLDLRSTDQAREDAGRTWLQLGEILQADDQEAESIAAFERALEDLDPVTVPRECRDAARHLASSLSDQEDWDRAARMWELAVQAAANAVELRFTSKGRIREARENLNIARWAAYALTRAGQPKRAVEIIEQGRARELAHWMQRESSDLASLRRLDPFLAEAHERLQANVEAHDHTGRLGVAHDLDLTLAQVGEEIQTVIAKIRQLPSLERFGEAPPWERIAEAASRGRPLAYVVTAPKGSVVLVVWRDDVANVQVIESSLTSTEVANTLFRLGTDTKEIGGYFLAQAGETDRLDEEMEHLGDLVGSSLLRPLAEALMDRGATHVSLVAVGIAGLLPLHTLTWKEGTRNRCLLDDVSVSFAPSAEAASVSDMRASARSRQPSSRLVVVGNPLPHSNPLPGAESEARIVAEAFGLQHTRMLVGSEATKDAVASALAHVSFIHFACHGASDMREDVFSAHLSLANETPFTAADIIAIEDVTARLVVLSACQTAIFQGYETADEVFGLATAFLAAGAAGVIATLWPVDDYATSLLMSRFYEGLGRGLEPAEALRACQLWLRSLTADEEFEYLASHPLLRAQRQSRARQFRSAGASDRPFSVPSIWAPFVLTGV